MQNNKQRLLMNFGEPQNMKTDVDRYAANEQARESRRISCKHQASRTVLYLVLPRDNTRFTCLTTWKIEEEIVEACKILFLMLFDYFSQKEKKMELKKICACWLKYLYQFGHEEKIGNQVLSVPYEAKPCAKYTERSQKVFLL